MKLNIWLSALLTSATAVSVLAQPAPPAPPPPAPAPAVNIAPTATAPTTESAAKPAKSTKPKAKKKATKTATETAKKKTKAAPAKTNMVLNPPEPARVKCEVLDVRGQGSFEGEVITHLKKGEIVTVMEQITLAHPKAHEPANWSRIMMPTNTPVWVSAEFIDADSKTVRAKSLNVRGGPGENYSVIGHLEKGTAVNEIRKSKGWMEIETPTNAYAFVASEYLESAPETETPAAAPTPPPAPAAPPVVVNVPAETLPVPARPVESAPPTPPPASTGLSAPAPTQASQADQELSALHRSTAPEPAATAPAAPTDMGKEELPRIVTREGFVRKCYNIQGPADYELHDIKSGDLIEYVQPAKGQKFKTYVGTRLRITGAENLDPRWPRTPILQVQSFDLMN